MKDLGEIDQIEVTLWRILGRYEKAVANEDAMAALKLEAGFLQHLKDYERACDALQD